MLLASLLAAVATASPPVRADAAPACLDLRQPHARVSLSGLLTVRRVAGPPNYESAATGDAEDKALILELGESICADDGGELVEAADRFDRVHVSASVPALLERLNAAVGRRITVRGTAFGAHSAHHRAPLVLFAEQVDLR